MAAGTSSSQNGIALSCARARPLSSSRTPSDTVILRSDTVILRPSPFLVIPSPYLPCHPERSEGSAPVWLSTTFQLRAGSERSEGSALTASRRSVRSGQAPRRICPFDFELPVPLVPVQEQILRRFARAVAIAALARRRPQNDRNRA